MKQILSAALSLLAFLALSLAPTARADSPVSSLFVDPKPLQTLAASPLGINTDIFFDGPNDWQAKNIAETLARAYGPLGVMRFPGGVTGDNYDWRTARVIDGRLYPRLSNQFTSQDVHGSRFTFDQFIQQTRKLEARPFVILNALSAWREGATEAVFAKYRNLAVDWVKYAREKHYDVTYWCYGNEPQFFIKEDAGKGYTLETFARAYAREFKRVYAEIKSVDPTARVGIPGVYFNAPIIQQVSWWTTLRSEGVDPDFVDVHTYFPEVRNTGNQAAQYAAAVARFRSIMGPRPKIVIGEFNRYWSGEIPAIDNDLAVVEMYLRYLEAGASEIVFFPLRAIKGDGFNRAFLKMSGEPNHPLFVFKQLKPFGRGTLHHIFNSGADIYGLASRHGTTTTVVVLNRGDVPHPIALERTLTEASAASGSSITRAATPADVTRFDLQLVGARGSLRAMLPARSISILTVQNAAEPGRAPVRRNAYSILRYR